MECIRPLRAGYNYEYGITFSKKEFNPELEGFKLPCRKCLPCRLNTAREKAIRCYHESKMHEDNIFLTLTYDEDHLKSPKLQYDDFQLFMKKLRKTQNQKIPMMVTGEYGEKNKRPHWHALLFNYRPNDERLTHQTDRGDKVFHSETLAHLWQKGKLEYGSITMDSANYVARYAAKKLVHGNDGDHDFHPIHKTSSKYGIGRSWIEQYYRHTFENGYVVLPNGERSKIPRYYIDWCKKNQPELYEFYGEHVLPKIQRDAEKKSQQEEENYRNAMTNRTDPKHLPLKKGNVKETILKQKFKKLQEKLKL